MVLPRGAVMPSIAYMPNICLHTKNCWVILSTQPLGYEMFNPLWVIIWVLGYFETTPCVGLTKMIDFDPTTWVVGTCCKITQYPYNNP